MAYPSQFVDIQNAIADRLRLTNTANDYVRIKDGINQAYTQACVETEAIQNHNTQSVSPGVQSTTITSTFVRIKTVVVTPTNGSQSRPLKRLTLDQILDLRSANGGASNTGPIWAYCVTGLNILEIYPAPPDTETLTVYYVGLPTPLLNDNDVPVLPEPYATECLKYGGMAKVAEYTGDPDGPYYQQLYMQSIAQLRAHLNRRGGRITGQFQLQDSRTFPPHDPSTDVGNYGGY